jgi:glycine hydroxymethyltransferase
MRQTREDPVTTPENRRPALTATDPELAALVTAEEQLQADTLRLIPSENYVSAAVLEASGTVLQNKYSEGYPGKRYYEGQQIIDQVETVAVERATSLFGMSLPMGGHLTHGWGVSATGTWFRGVQYGVRRDTGRIDLDEVRDLALAERPKVIFCGGTAVPREIDFAGFAEIAEETGAVLVADIAHIAGLIAGGAHPSPAPYADVVSTTTHKTLRGPRGGMLLSRAEHARAIDRAVFPGLQGGPHNQTTAAIAVALKEAATPDFSAYAHHVVANARALGEELASRGFDLVSGGTDNHLLLIDLTGKDVPGKIAAKALDRAGIVVNYNAVPYDPRKPFDPSGIRIGTPALTSRGIPASEMGTVAEWIGRVVEAARTGDESAIEKVRAEVKILMDAYPAPGLPVG